MVNRRRPSRFSSALIRRAVVTVDNVAPPTLRDPMVLVRAALSVSDQNDDPTAPWQYLDLDPIILAES